MAEISQINSSLWRCMPKDDAKDRIEVLIGDESGQGFKPTTKLRRWDEVSIGLDFPVKPVEQPGVDGETLKQVVSGNFELHWNDSKEGFAFDVVLHKKWSGSSIALPINLDGLKAYYQPPLTEEEEGIRAHFPKVVTVTENEALDSKNHAILYRPPEVVGSYAFYRLTRQANKAGGKAYRAGKAFHLYRPIATDNLGSEHYIPITISENKLILDLSDPWFNTATYPVHIDPTFGYTSAGGSQWDVDGADMLLGVVGTPVDGDGDVDSISVYVDAGGGTHVKGVVIDSASETIVDSQVGGEVSLGAQANWYTSTFSTKPAVTNNTEYYPSVVCDKSGWDIYYDAGEQGDEMYDYSNSYDSPTDPTDALYWEPLLSIYATYTPSVTNYELQVDAGSINVSGQDLNPEFHRVLSAGIGAYTVSGQTMNPEYHRVIFPDGGTVTVSGQTVSFLRDYLIPISEGNYVVTGQAISFLRNYLLSIGAGAYGIAGQDVTLSKGIKLTVDAGSITVSGQAISFLRDYLVSIGAGSIAVAGQDVNPEYHRKFNVESGSYLIAGTDTNPEYHRLISIGSGSFVIAGQDTPLKYARIFTVNPGAYAIAAGDDVTFYKGFIINVEAGSISVSGQDITLTRDAKITISPGAYTIAGQAVTFYKGYILSVGSGSYTINGQDAGFLRDRIFPVEAGSIDLSGQDIGLLKDSKIGIEAGGYLITGQAASALYNRLITAGAGAYLLSGQDLTLTYASNEATYELVAESGQVIVSGIDAELIFAWIGEQLMTAYLEKDAGAKALLELDAGLMAHLEKDQKIKGRL